MSFGRRFRGLSLLIGAGALEPAPAEVMEALEKVEIDARLGERGTFRLTFRLERGSLLPERFLSSSGDLVRVVVSTGESTDSQVAMDGVMAAYAVSAGEEESRLVIDGEDLTLLMDLLDHSGRPFPGMPVEARVAVILAAYAVRGVTPLIIPAPVPEVPDPAGQIFHQQGTDYAYVRSLARRAGYRFKLDPGPVPGSSVAFWGPEPHGDRSRPTLAIRFGHAGPVETLELRFDALGRVAPAATILDPRSKIAIPIPVPNLTALGPPLGAVVPPPQRHRRLPGAAKLTATQAAGALLAEAARTAESTRGVGRLNVGPDQRRLRPGDIVEVEDAADPFDGLYAVDRARDTLTAESHRQDFELVRAGLGAAGGGTT